MRRAKGIVATGWVCLLVACGASGLLACGSSESWSQLDSDNGRGGGGPSQIAGPSSTTGNGAGGGENNAPPEQELESNFGAPVATGRYVWIANPSSGRVAYIDGKTLQIQIVDAGHGPTHLAAVPDPDDDVAIVLNTLSHDATVLRAKQGALSSTQLAVHATANRWAISPDGRWATAWTDPSAIKNDDPLDGHQEISVLDLHNDTSTQLSVGYRPQSLHYADTSAQLHVVSEEGITTIALGSGGASVKAHFALTDDPLEDPNARDVAITPDGQLALVRRVDEARLSVFDTNDGSHLDLALPGPVTDLDLSADGSHAVAVIRSTGHVAFIPCATILDNPNSLSIVDVSATVVGSVSLPSDASLAFLYTNALPVETITVLDTGIPAPIPRLIKLHAAVSSVFPTPDASHALVLHSAPPGESKYDASISLVPVAAQLPSKIRGLESAPISVAMAPDNQRALLALGSTADSPYQMVVARFPSLEIDVFTLGSAPIAAGIVAGAGSGFVAQQHPEGRITFIDFDTGQVRTLTGFELATQVVNGSTP
jgi:hypothetical protein